MGDLVRMQKKEWDVKQNQVKPRLQILLSELRFFTNLKTKKIKFNSKPSKKIKQKTEPETYAETPTFIDLNLDTTSKIDELIKKHELQNINKEEPLEKTTLTQIREPWSRTLKKSLFQPETIQSTFEKNDSLFELERGPSFNQNTHTNNLTPLSNQVISFNEPLTSEHIDSIEKIDDNQNLLAGLAIKLNRNPNQTITQKQTTTQKTKEVKIAQTDLENAKQELERKKHELEEMQRFAKEKEEELKKKEEEEKKLEKLNKIRQKQLEKENIIKEKQLRIEQKRQEKENKIKEKQLQIELEKQEKLRKIEEEKLQREQERQEKIRKIEEEKILREQELQRMLKEKEEREKQEKLKKIEEEKILREKELQRMLKEKEEIEKQIARKKIEEITYKKAREKEGQHVLEPRIDIKTQKLAKTNKPEMANIDFLDEEVGKALKIIDNLLEKLPEEVITEFINSKDFKIYERVVNKYNKK